MKLLPRLGVTWSTRMTSHKTTSARHPQQQPATSRCRHKPLHSHHTQQQQPATSRHCHKPLYSKRRHRPGVLRCSTLTSLMRYNYTATWLLKQATKISACECHMHALPKIRHLLTLIPLPNHVISVKKAIFCYSQAWNESMFQKPPLVSTWHKVKTTQQQRRKGYTP